MAGSRNHLARWLAPSSIIVTITNPTAGGTLTNAASTIAWSFAPGTQLTARVRIYTDVELTTLTYDSGILVQSATTHTLPAGALLSIGTYFVIVDVVTTTGLSGQGGPVAFFTAFAPSVNVSGVDVRPFGGLCDGNNAIPYNRVSWSVVVPGGGETFHNYAVRRRVGGTTDWDTIYTTATQSQTFYDDYNVNSNEVYEYSVVWVATSGINTLISTDTNPPPNAFPRFDHAWLHDVTNPSAYNVRLHSWDLTEEVVSEIKYMRSWGRTAPSVQIGPQEYTRVGINVTPQLLRDPIHWERIRQLIARARTNGSPLCLRTGRSRILIFCAVEQASRQIGPKQYTPQLNITEIHYDESVSVST